MARGHPAREMAALGPPGGGVGLCLREPGPRRGPRYGAAPGRACSAVWRHRGDGAGRRPGPAPAEGRAGPGSHSGRGGPGGGGHAGLCPLTGRGGSGGPYGGDGVPSPALAERDPGVSAGRSGMGEAPCGRRDDGGTWEFPVPVAPWPVPPAVRCRPGAARSIPGTAGAVPSGSPSGVPRPWRTPVCPCLSQGKEGFPPAGTDQREHRGGFPRSGFCAWGGKGITLHFELLRFLLLHCLDYNSFGKIFVLGKQG